MSSDFSYSMGSSADYNEAEDLNCGESTEAKWRFIDGDTLRRFQNEAIAYAQDTLQCTRSQAMIVLRHYRWNREKLLEAVGEIGKDRAFKLAGVHCSSDAINAKRPGFNSGPETCMICMEEQECCTTMECGHTFCNECWLSHLKVRIMEGSSCAIPCMEFKCGAICDDSIVCALLRDADPDALKRYEHCRLQSYIEDNAMVAWCPSVPCCGRAVEALDDVYCEPLCPCGQHFCFKCGGAAHSPCTCDMWEKWKEKEGGESETKNWLQANTKPCPKCNVPVEKDGGCNLVVCRSCHQPFCWLCGMKTGTSHTWEVIDGHTCGQWKDDMQKAATDSKRRLERYLHYYKHYQAHLVSAEKENSGKALREIIPQLINGCVSELVDFGYLENGDRILAECRRVLANSYVLAYFMFGNDMFADDISQEQALIMQHRFEDTQQTLNHTAEALSALMRHTLRDFQVRLAWAGEAEGEGNTTTTATTPSANNNSSNSSATEAMAGPVGKRQKVADDEQQVRLEIINLTNNIDVRISKLFDLIESEILAAVHSRNSQIAPRFAMIKTNQ